MKKKNPFKKAVQLAVLANPVRFKILLALFISEVMEKRKTKRKANKKMKETKDCVCMPMCIKHDCPRPCPICDKEWFDKENN